MPGTPFGLDGPGDGARGGDTFISSPLPPFPPSASLLLVSSAAGSRQSTPATCFNGITIGDFARTPTGHMNIVRTLASIENEPFGTCETTSRVAGSAVAPRCDFWRVGATDRALDVADGWLDVAGGLRAVD